MDANRIETESRLAMIAGPVVILAMVGWLAGFGGAAASGGAAEAAWVLITSSPWAIGWLLAAIGLGWPLRRWLAPDHPDATAIQVGLGIAAMITLDAALGATGVLQWFGAGGAWALVVVGIGLLVEQLRRSTHRAPVLPLIAWAAIPAVAVLLVAACSAPGWLWSSEFGGYDALSYHLQLPSEWRAIGRITPLEHNVYSWLPDYVESAYYHLAVLMGDGLGAVYACQLLHALFALLTAALTGRLARRLVRPAGGTWIATGAAVVLLGTPWVIVVGSLAYNEMVVTLLLATGLLVLAGGERPGTRAAVVVGILAAAACGAKLTAVGFVAAPLGVLLLAAAPARDWPRLGAAAAGAGLVCLLPWLVRNGVYSGNPVFPFATGLFGLGHWTAEQAEIWTRAHAAGTGLAGRLAATWNALLRYGIGANPDPSEPWLPQWSLLPWMALAGLAAAAASPGLRRAGARLGVVLLLQLVFWMTFTHLQSRFLVPVVVPGALAVSLGIAAIDERLHPGATRTALGAAAILAAVIWCCLPGAIFLREDDGAPAARVGRAMMLSGDDLPATRRRVFFDSVPAIAINYMLPPGSKVLLIGDATPLYYRADVTYQTTWDRGPLSAAMRAHPGDPAAWAADLRRQGFTHLFVDPTMLLIWERSGWNDPLITLSRVLEMADGSADLLQVYPDGSRLYRLRDDMLH